MEVIGSPVQELILKACLLRGGSVALADLIDDAERLVKYRAAAALSANSLLLERKGVIKRIKQGRKVYVFLSFEWVERLRKILGVKAPNCFISGYTWNPMKPSDLNPLKTFFDGLTKLESEGFKISKVICFTTPEASAKLREVADKIGVQRLPDKEVKHPFSFYQTSYEDLKFEVKRVVDSEIYDYTIILDVTPLTKLFSDCIAWISEKYGLPRIYHFAPRIVWLKK